MSHRVIAGTAKGRRLQLVPGDATRPVMDRVKEAAFNIIGTEILDATFLDLFAGTGAVGIEALSRGARLAVLYDTDRQAIKTVEANLKTTGLKDRAQVRRTDSMVVLRGKAPTKPFDYIYVAPPQYQGIWLETLKLLDAKPEWVGAETTVIVQIDPEERQPVRFEHLEIADERRYGKTLLLFVERKELDIAMQRDAEDEADVRDA